MNRNHFSFRITLVLCFHSILVQSSSWVNICTKSCSTPILGEDFIETRAAELSKACYDVDFDHFKALLVMDPKTLKKVLNHVIKPPKDDNFFNDPHMTPFLNFCISASRVLIQDEFSGNTLRSSYLEVLGLLLKGGADPNSSVFDGTTPLILALRYEHFEWIDLLLSHGADPNCVDFSGFNPLLYACAQGDSELISILLGASANPNFVYKFKYDPRFLFDDMFKFSPIDHEYIQNIVKDYDLDAQYNLIKLVPETERLQIVYELGFYGIIRSQYRSYGVKLERCKYLKEYQKENGIDRDKSLLFCSVLDGNISMLKCFLMKRQFSSYVKVTYYDFVLYFEFGRPRSNISLLEAACVTDDLGIVEFLINQGAKVTQAALVWAAKRGNLFLIKKFVEEFELLETDFKNKNIFDGAIVSGNQELIDYLMETYNYKFDEENCEIAAQFGHLEIIKDCHTKHEIRLTGKMLKLAAGNDHLQVVQYEPLLKHFEPSVLEVAVKYGSYKVVEFFVSIKKTIITQEMVDDAVKRGHYNLVKYYKESYGNLRPSTSSLELAAMNEHFKTLELYPGCYKYLSQVALNSLAGSGDLNLITRLTKVDAQGRITNFSSDAIFFASINGHLNIVNYFLVKRFSTDRSLYGQYLISFKNPGPVEMVQNLLDYGAEITTEAFKYLIEGGHYKAYEVVLNHAMKNKDFQFDPRIMDIFNEHTGGNVEMVKSLFSHKRGRLLV